MCTVYGLRSMHCILFNCNHDLLPYHKVTDIVDGDKMLSLYRMQYWVLQNLPIINTLFGNKVDYFA